MKDEQVKQNDLHHRATGTKNKHVKHALNDEMKKSDWLDTLEEQMIYDQAVDLLNKLFKNKYHKL